MNDVGEIGPRNSLKPAKINRYLIEHYEWSERFRDVEMVVSGCIVGYLNICG